MVSMSELRRGHKYGYPSKTRKNRQINRNEKKKFIRIQAHRHVWFIASNNVVACIQCGEVRVANGL